MTQATQQPLTVTASSSPLFDSQSLTILAMSGLFVAWILDFVNELLYTWYWFDLTTYKYVYTHSILNSIFSSLISIVLLLIGISMVRYITSNKKSERYISYYGLVLVIITAFPLGIDLIYLFTGETLFLVAPVLVANYWVIQIIMGLLATIMLGVAINFPTDSNVLVSLKQILIGAPIVTVIYGLSISRIDNPTFSVWIQQSLAIFMTSILCVTFLILGYRYHQFNEANRENRDNISVT